LLRERHVFPTSTSEEKAMAETKLHPILIVDDEAEVSYSLRALLRREFEVHTAESEYQAFQVLNWHPIHVILADQRMPGRTGVDLLGRVRREFPDVVRLLFTGYADIGAVIDAINKGHVYRYISKPWEPEEMRLVLHEACERYDRAQERKHLLADMRGYLAQSQALTRRLREGQAEAAPAGQGEEDQLAEAGTSLLARLDRALTPA
jgi:DNA-binding NtrC family response regulator